MTTVPIERGLVELREPETTLRLEAPAGVVEVRARCKDGRVKSVEPHEARALCDAGERIRTAAKVQLDERVSIVQIAEPWRGVGQVTKNAGLSARMATLHARGLMQVGDSMTHASPIGSTFDGRIVAATEQGIVPAISGGAWITGVSELYVDDDDPFPEGYLLSDTWPGGDTQ